MTGPESRSLLHRVFSATLLYPALVVLFLYAEWYLAWVVLGHPPLPSWNDPKSIEVSGELHPVTGLVLLGALPMVSASLVLSVVSGLLPRFSLPRLAGRLAVFLATWLTLFLFLRWDPGRVLEWWLD